MPTAEHQRLQENAHDPAPWHRWGPYLSERQWGTVREDYSADQEPAAYFPHDHARLRAYRWGEDGLGGICDRQGLLCFSMAFWNGRDPILKERLFGLSNGQGNHGEDVKEYYHYLDNTPTHSYMKFLYKYPQAEYPYRQLLESGWVRSRSEPEFELVDTGIFNENRSFDVVIEYAKASPDDLCIRVNITHFGPEEASLTVLPTLWFRNTWSWHPGAKKPRIACDPSGGLMATSDELGTRWLVCENAAEYLFTENETNFQALYGTPNRTPHVKDAFHEYVVRRRLDAVNPRKEGTKAAAIYRLKLKTGETQSLRIRLSDYQQNPPARGETFDALFETRKREADEFYASISSHRNEDDRNIQRQAFASMLWSKQFYHYDVHTWLYGDPGQLPPPASRLKGRNSRWKGFYAEDILSMPDKWEYPYFCAWDLSFHCLVLAMLDPEFAKDQSLLLMTAFYTHPSGQLPAYEWALEDANPPVEAWSAWRVFTIERRISGKGDVKFLEEAFHKLLLGFTWWSNRLDNDGNNIFEGGFLGLDNVGVFDRRFKLEDGSCIEQSDGTSWMAMRCLNMLTIAAELSKTDTSYEHVSARFLNYFMYMAHSMNNPGEQGVALWDEEDGFYYDVLRRKDGSNIYLKVRSMVGLIPLFAVETLEGDVFDRMPVLRKRLDRLLHVRPELAQGLAYGQTPGEQGRRLFAVVNRDRLRRVLLRMLDENEFLSPHGIRSLSKIYKDHPYVIQVGGCDHTIDYEPAESQIPMFGGNSNWRGPIWMPMNYLIIESLQKFHFYLGDDYKVECPTGSGNMMNLWEVSLELEKRLLKLFQKDASGKRPIHGNHPLYQENPQWRDLLNFPEYFHGDNGAGLGAMHQTGWTALIAKLITQLGEWGGES